MPDFSAALETPLFLAGLVLVAGFLLDRMVLQSYPVAQFICQLVSFVAFTAILLAARIIPFRLTLAPSLTVESTLGAAFKVVWWLAAAWLLSGLVRAVLVFKRRPVETRFLQDLFAGFIYVGAILGIIADVFGIPVSGLLAASGVIAIVLGLALQSTLGDVFSGVVLNFAKPFHPGDWVLLNDGGLQGRVIETNWRATQILTLEGDLAVVPNSIIAKARLINASLPTPAHGVTLIVRLDPAVAPGASIAVLERAMLSCNHILQQPSPQVRLRLLDASALECELAFTVAEIALAPRGQNEVFDRVFRHCAASGIRLAPPANAGLLLQPRDTLPELGDVAHLLLERLPVFAPLSAAERLDLAPKMRRCTYEAGAILIEQDVVAQALFILYTGVLSALQSHGGAEQELFRLAPGDCFAEASMLTGAPTMFKVRALTRVVVYKIDHADIAPLLKARPAIAVELGQVMANRQSAGRARLAELDDDARHENTLADRLMGRIKLVFGLGDSP